MTLNTPQQIANPSPKARFQSVSDNIAKHRKLLELPELQRGFDFAMLQYSAQVGENAKDQLSAIMSAAKIQAIHEFLATFRMLADQTQPIPVRKDTDNLSSN